MIPNMERTRKENRVHDSKKVSNLTGQKEKKKKKKNKKIKIKNKTKQNQGPYNQNK
jgi:hypothetical protein